MEEERRLCYVAITRAKKSLTLSYARTRTIFGRTSTNLPARFLDELPEDCVKRTGRLPSYASDRPRDYGTFGRISSYSEPDGFSQLPQTKHRSADSFASRPAPKAAAPAFCEGEQVMHKAFGKGMILTVLPMGNDALLEIAFDNVGTKRLMAKTAAAHMTKL